MKIYLKLILNCFIFAAGVSAVVTVPLFLFFYFLIIFGKLIKSLFSWGKNGSESNKLRETQGIAKSREQVLESPGGRPIHAL